MIVESAPKRKDRSDEQPPLLPIEPSKPTTPPAKEPDWKTIKKIGDDNQAELAREREKEKEKKGDWTDH